MKTFIQQLTILMVSVMWSFSLHAAIPVVNDAGSTAGPNELVRAKMIDGIWMPIVDLPEVEISASRLDGAIYKGYIINNQVIAQAGLPEVVIEARSSEKPSENPDIIGDSNLPLIEITASFPEHVLTEALRFDNKLMAVVQLPEIIIDGNSDIDTHMLFPELAGMIENVSVTEASDNGSGIQVHFTPEMFENILMTAQRCVRLEEEKLICDVSMMITSNEEEPVIREKIFRLVFNYH